MKTLNLQEKYMICSQLEMILSSGFQIDIGLEMIEKEIEDKEISAVITKLKEEMKQTMTFSEAIQSTGCFDDYMEYMVAIGDESGQLDEVMTSLTKYYQRMDEIEKQYYHALTYPAVLMIMMMVVVGVIAFKILPLFESMLRSLGSDLTSIARVFMSFGQVFSYICFMILLIISLMIIIIVLIDRKKPEKQIYKNIVKKIMFNKKIQDLMNQAQLTYTLSLFLSSGYDLSQAIQYLPNFIEDQQLKIKLLKCKEDIENGKSFEEVIKTNQLYQGMYLNMIQIGFQMGKLDEVMKTISQLYDDEVYLAIQKFLNIVEPSIVMILSVIVGIILLSILLPLVSVMSLI